MGLLLLPLCCRVAAQAANAAAAASILLLFIATALLFVCVGVGEGCVLDLNAKKGNARRDGQKVRFSEVLVKEAKDRTKAFLPQRVLHRLLQ